MNQKISYERASLRLTTFDTEDVILTSEPVETGDNGIPIIPLVP